MTTPARTVGKFGRLPAQFPAGLRDLTYYVAGPLPKAPAAMPVPPLPAWGMLGNSEYGDCGAAGLEHGMEAAAASAGDYESFPTTPQTIAYYLHYTGGQDTGVILSQYLAYVRRHGYYGHTVKAYAPVAVQDIPTLQTATWLYDFTYCGITVTQAMMDAFSNGQPWTTGTTQGTVLGGHCIPIVGYDGQHLYAVTWGAVQKIEYPAWHAIAEEAWAVITGEVTKGDGHGISLAALEADLNRLDSEAPAATTEPGTGGSLIHELAAKVRAAAANTDRDLSEVDGAECHAHGV